MFYKQQIQNGGLTMFDGEWRGLTDLESHSYICGHCGESIATKSGYQAIIKGYMEAAIYICHSCNQPSFFMFTGGEAVCQCPGHKFGSSVKGIPENETNDLYEEARNSFSAGAYTATVLCCRKLLMHIGVSKGADEGKSFAHYIKYLEDHHYISSEYHHWVDHIRTKGNEANHEILIIPKEDAEELLAFCEMLLKILYEFPATVASRYMTAPTSSEEE